MKHVVIIGNGITGITTARYLRKLSDYKITVISAETDHFYSRTALMYIYMGHMKFEDTKPYENWFWQEKNIGLKRGEVVKLDTVDKTIHLQNGKQMGYDILVLATGSKSNKFGWPGQDLKGVQGMYNYQDLELLEKNARNIQHAVLVGGGLIGIEMAEMLDSRHIPVTFLVREKNFWNIVLPIEEGKIISRHIREHRIDLRLETELKEILPDDAGRVKAVVTTNGEEIPCQFVGLTVGVSPNIEWLKNSSIEIDRGILVDEYFATNALDVYSGGDCAQFRKPLPGRRPIEQVWYTGKMHGMNIAKNICGEKVPYNPGVWFNSAKFLDIEYQTYGVVLPHLPKDQETLYWEDESGKKCVRINYSKEDKNVLGFNFFGIRARHEVCKNWISEKKSLEHVLTNLGALNFDPEFFPAFEEKVIALYNSQNPQQSVRLETRKGLFSGYWESLFARQEVRS